MSLLGDSQESYAGDGYGEPLPYGAYAQEEIAPFAVHQCNVCNKIFMSFKGLQQHSVIHTDSKPFICDVCGRGFRFKSNMFEHRTVHTGYTPHLCPFCGKQFRLKGNMKKHMRIHVTNKEELEAAYRPYSSNRRMAAMIPENALVIRGAPMPYLFPDKRKNAQRQLRLGSDPSKWVDRICDNQLIPTIPFNEKMLHASMRLNGAQTLAEVVDNAKPLEFEIFFCPLCKYECNGREECDIHIYTSHGKRPCEIAAEPYFCTKCMRKFMDENMFLQHRSYHSRVQLMMRNQEIDMSTPEVDLAQICYSMFSTGPNDLIVAKQSRSLLP
ncbi:unnamed protein product [Caenorhabditis brenneri]